MDAEQERCERPFLADRLAHRSEFRRDIEAAVRLGISHRRFAGWEPREVTEHEYDPDNGRLVRSVTTREVEWDEEQRGFVLGLLTYEAQVCHGCGGWLPETTNGDNEGRYHVDTPGRCYRCKAIHKKQDDYEKQTPRSLVLWPAELKAKKEVARG